jgi:general secretion pathway protein D
MKPHKNNYPLLVLCLSWLISGCASTLLNPEPTPSDRTVAVQPSYLEREKSASTVDESVQVIDEVPNSEFIWLNKGRLNGNGVTLDIDLSAEFSKTNTYQVSVNELPLNDFLHYALGELLSVSYLIEPKVKANQTPVTLELKETVSGQRLFQLVQQVLNQNNITIALNEGVYYVHQIIAKGNKSNIAFGYGRNEQDVPNVSSDIIQLVPLKYGTSRGLQNTINALVNAKVAMDAEQGLLTLTGKRQQILRALSLVHLLDGMAGNNKAIALLSFNYIDSTTFIDKVTELLSKENISAKRTLNSSSTVQFVPIEHLGKVVVFAISNEILDRVQYWSKQLDKPATGSEQSFYTYNPRFARASDLGSSLAPLISPNSSRLNTSNTSEGGRNNSSASNGNINGSNNNSNRSSGVQTIEGDELRLVVDERSNALIFYSTGKFYQELLPIIKKLDVMPKQVMLEVVIAEVKLTGSFAKGVEFAIQNGRSGNKTESFSFNSDSGFGYSVVGLNGNVNINLNQTDGLINVLSRPTILVRDGVSASISVGDDIPTVGSTTSDPINGERQTTAIQYRTTGIDLKVTPTINAQGTVIMTIEQNISNISPDGLSIGGSPSVFERKLSTEVVAGDGQSVMLGGLISENKSSNSSAVPLLGSLPLLGHLFRSDSENSDRTELVVLVTPRIIHNEKQWQTIQQSFTQKLDNIKL